MIDMVNVIGDIVSIVNKDRFDNYSIVHEYLNKVGFDMEDLAVDSNVLVKDNDATITLDDTFYSGGLVVTTLVFMSSEVEATIKLKRTL